MFISPAYAQAAGGPAGGGFLGMIVPLILLMAVFWFLLIRPQQKKMKEHQALIKAVRRGDMIVTNGGLIGKVARVIDDNEILMELAEGVRVRLQKMAIAEVRSKGEPAPANDSAPAKKPARKRAAKKKSA